MVTVEDDEKKFNKVKEYGEEAVIYVTSIIATPIKVDKNEQIISYPDYGGYNGMNEYKEGDNIYCKKNVVKGVIKSIFPTYKAYIYRGNKKGEAIQKLKQDIKNNTFKNAESTVLEIARHVASQNLTYESEGLTTPNDVNNLYEIKYQYGESKGRPSFRYRIVENRLINNSNFPKIKTLSQEVYNGNMAIGKRSSMSFDPWRSNALIGCLGFKGKGGDYHPSCAERAKNDYNDKIKYKFIYHALNNYLETVIPELTGIYGRRGYKYTGEVNVSASKYDHEVNVFLLLDKLPELNKKDRLFTEEDARKALRVIYDKYGVEIAKNVEMIYRWECSHFKSGQYKHCGGPGMEAANSNHPNYGWNGDIYKKYSQYTPVGLWDSYENEGMSGKGGNKQVTDKKKNYVKFPSVEAGMVYVAEFLLRYKGNVGRWHSKDDPKVQDNYKKNITTTIPRIVNSFK